MNRKRSYISDLYKEKDKRLRSMGIVDHISSTTDIKTALTSLKSLFPVGKFQKHLPPIIMKHQVYAFVFDRTDVDRQLNEMRKNGEIRMFKLGSSHEELAIVFLEDYVKHVKSNYNNSSVCQFLQRVVQVCPDISFSRDTLMKQYSMKEENIKDLIQYGLLTSRDVGCYWLAIPLAGEFVKAFSFGRRATLQYVRRTKYKEILQSELEQRKLPRKAILGVLYHIYDLIGADLVECIDTSTGRMLRLQQESHRS